MASELAALLERVKAARWRAAELIDRLEMSCTEDAESDPQLALAWERYKAANRDVSAAISALSQGEERMSETAESIIAKALVEVAWKPMVRAREVIDALDRAGYAVVPKEPTEVMIDTASDQFDWGPPGYDDAPQGAASPGSVYKIMLAAHSGETPK